MKEIVYRVPPQVSSGIYHLLKGETVVYVGQSADLMRRISHWTAARPFFFDGYRLFPCEVGRLNEVEAEHIEHYRPRHNRAGNTRAFLPVKRWPGEPRALSADLLERWEHITGGQACISSGAATTVEHLLALVDAGLFPAPVAKRNIGRPVFYWEGKAVARWVREHPRAGVAV